MPNFTRLKDLHGKRVPHGKKAAASAEYLEKVQWTNPNHAPPKINPPKIINQDLQMDCEKIKIEELDHTIGVLKNNKALGPDKCTTELFKHLDENNRLLFLDILYLIWTHEKVPKEFLNATVASILKKGEY